MWHTDALFAALDSRRESKSCVSIWFERWRRPARKFFGLISYDVSWGPRVKQHCSTQAGTALALTCAAQRGDGHCRIG